MARTHQWTPPPSRGVWRSPDDTLTRSAQESFGAVRIPRNSTGYPRVEAPVDMRSGNSPALPGDDTILAASATGGHVTLVASPPREGPEWTFDLRVWMPGAAASDVACVALLHEDHAIADFDLRDGARRCFHEVVPAGWQIEVFLPSGEIIVLRDLDASA